MDAEPLPHEVPSESPSAIIEEETTNKENHTNAVAPAVTTGTELSAPSALPTAKDTPKSNSKKPKKRKPKVPRDVTAPRQPLTGNFSIYS